MNVWLKWTAIGVGGLLALFAAIAVAVYFLVPGIRGSEPESTARYFPEGTAIYSWATFSPGIGQGRQMLDLWNRFEELPRFEETVDDLLEELEAETGIDIEEEVLPWVGPDLSLGVMNVTEESGDVVALIGVKDQDAASDFLRELLEYMEDEGVSLRREDDVHGFEVWADWDSDASLALSSDWFLFASAEDALNDVLSLVSGEEVQSLANTPSFQEARTAMNGDRAMSLYVDLEAFSELSGFGVDALSDATGVDLPSDADSVGDVNTPDWLVVSGTFIERGIAMETVTPYDSDFLGWVDLTDEPAKLLPDDTLFLGATSFEPDMDRWRAELEQYTLVDLLGSEAAYDLIEELPGLVPEDFDNELDYDATLAEALDYVIDLIDHSIDIHLEEDLFDHLGGQAVIGVRDFDLDRAEDVERYAIDAVAMLSYVPGGEEGLMHTVDELVDLLAEESGEEFPPRTSRDIGADHEAVTFDVEDLMGETAYSPGYVFHGGYMTIGSTERALRAIVDSQKGARAALDGTQAYQRARESLPDVVQFLMFLDLHRIIVQMDPDSLGIDPDYYEILEKAFGAVAVSDSAEGDHLRASFVLTLFPE